MLPTEAILSILIKLSQDINHQVSKQILLVASIAQQLLGYMVKGLLVVIGFNLRALLRESEILGIGSRKPVFHKTVETIKERLNIFGEDSLLIKSYVRLCGRVNRFSWHWKPALRVGFIEQYVKDEEARGN